MIPTLYSFRIVCAYLGTYNFKKILIIYTFKRNDNFVTNPGKSEHMMNVYLVLNYPESLLFLRFINQ